MLFSGYIIGQNILEKDKDFFYSFIERMSDEGIISGEINYFPLARLHATELLNEINEKKELLNYEDRKLYNYYLKEFDYEINLINNSFDKNKKDSLNLFSKYNHTFNILEIKKDDFYLSLNPLIYIEYNYNIENLFREGHGFEVRGFWGNFKFQTKFIDNTIYGKLIDTNRILSPLQGLAFKKIGKNQLAYDIVEGGISFENSDINIGIRKGNFIVGSGINSQIIMSDKAPGFPYFYLNIYPSKYFSYNFVLGILNSSIIDSTTIRHNINPSRVNYSLVEKYIALHLFSFNLFSSLKLSIGESVIFSDKFQPIYLIPNLFFRSVDHYQNYTDNTGGNAQIFGDFSYKIPELGTKLYTTLFIDELSLTSILKDEHKPKAIAYTVGIIKQDLLLNNDNLNIEYSKLDPFVYYHLDDALDYSSYGYYMGDWIGNNADEISASYIFDPYPFTSLGINYNYIRKGEVIPKGSDRYLSNQTFLFGERSTLMQLDFSMKLKIYDYLDLYSNLIFTKAEGVFKEFNSNTQFKLGLNFTDF